MPAPPAADPGSYFGAETAQAVKGSGMRGNDRPHGVRHGPDGDGQSAEGFFEPTDEALVRADANVAEFDGTSTDG